jgi:tRNA threonylcarbamoyladenosine biosynthesis protein TsaB
MTLAEDSIPFHPLGAIVPDFDRVLVLETSGRVGQVALASGDHVLAEERLTEAHRRASDLALVVNHLLVNRGWKARDLTGVVVGLGPGSYTGLRVGLASAKALAYAIGCQFFGVETFAAIALRAPQEFNEISVVADALQGRVFRRDYHRNGVLTPLCPLQIVTRDDWIKSLRPGLVASGPAAGLFDVRRVDETDREPRPIDLLKAAQTCPWAVNTDVWRAEPLYLRGSSAEEKAAGR